MFESLTYDLVRESTTDRSDGSAKPREESSVALVRRKRHVVCFDHNSAPVRSFSTRNWLTIDLSNALSREQFRRQYVRRWYVLLLAVCLILSPNREVPPVILADTETLYISLGLDRERM